MASAKTARRCEHLFFLGLALLLIGYGLLGFWKSYFGAGLVLAALPSLLVHVHAILFVGWLALFAVQTALIGRGRVALHRRLGIVMGWWAAAMIVIGPATTVMAVRRRGSGVDAAVFGADLVEAIAFAILIGAGLIRRRDPISHKRLMALASAAMIAPAIVRWPFGFIQQGPVAPSIFFLLPPIALAAYDLATRRRVHGATWLGLALMVAVLASFVALPAWRPWLDFTAWVRQV